MEKYVEPKIEIVEFDKEDIIVTSGPVNETPFEPVNQDYYQY